MLKSILIVSLYGCTLYADSAPNCQELISTEESTLAKWILFIDQYGMLSQAVTVQKMANLLLIKQSKSTSTSIIIGRN